MIASTFSHEQGRSSSRNRGYGLLEIALGIAVAALLVAWAMMYFQNANEGRRVKETMELVTTIRSAMEQLHAGMPSLSTDGPLYSLLARSPMIPNKFKGTTEGIELLKNPFGGLVVLQPHTSGTSENYMILLSGIPPAACVSLASSSIGSSSSSFYPNLVVVQNTRRVTNLGAFSRITPDQLGVACDSGPLGNEMGFLGR